MSIATARQELLRAQHEAHVAHLRFLEAVRVAEQAEAAFREIVSPARLRIMLTTYGESRHMGRRLPDGTAVALCGLVLDVGRTERVARRRRGRVRRPDCKRCAEILALGRPAARSALS